MGLETAAALGGLVLSGVTTGISFTQAGEQQAKQRKAEEAVAKTMDEARKKLEVNFYNKQAIKKEPYELQREALLSQGALAIQAGQESDRGAAATAGRVQMAQNEAQAGIRTAMTNEMVDIENKQIAEQSRLRDLGVQLDLGQAEGAQMAAANAEEAATAATAQGIQGIMGTAQQGLNLLPLYFKDNKIPMGGTSGGDPGTQINQTAPKYSGSSFTPMNTSTNPLGYVPKYNGMNGIPGVTSTAPNFNTGNTLMFPQYDAFGNIIRR